MSSYDQYFFGIQKYGSSAFKRTINHVSTTSSYAFTLWDICAWKSSKRGIEWFSHIPTWLPASYIAEKCYPVYCSSWVVPFLDFFDYINDFWATRRSPGAIKIFTDSWDDVLHDLIIYVSRSGKFTAFYIPYISHIALKPAGGHMVKSIASRIWGGIHKNTSY